MPDERAATWKVFLSADSLNRVLAINVDAGVISGLARSSRSIESFSDSGDMVIAQIQDHQNIHVHQSQESISGLYTLIVLGGVTIGRDLLNTIAVKHCSKNTTFVILNSANQLAVTTLTHKYGLTVNKTIVGLPASMPRIYIPAESNEILNKGLSFHKPASLLSRTALKFLRLLCKYGLNYPLNRKPILFLSNTRDSNLITPPAYQTWLEQKVGYPLAGLVAYAGSESIKRKLTLLAVSGKSGFPDYVVKACDTHDGAEAIKHESEALSALAGSQLNRHVPRLLFENVYTDGSLIQGQSMNDSDCDQVQFLSESHVVFLNQLTELNVEIKNIAESSQWQSLKKDIQISKGTTTPPQISKLYGIIEDAVSNGALSLFHFTHGDFTPWNISACRNNIFVYDWEDSQKDGLMGCDIFHFLYRHADLVGPWKGADNLYKEIVDNFETIYMNTLQSINSDIVLGVILLKEYYKKPTEHLIEMVDYLVRKISQ